MDNVVVESLWLSYKSGEWVLKNVNLRAGKGLLLVAGGTGSGKSSLLRAVAGTATRVHGARIRGMIRVRGRPLLIPQETDLFLLMPTVGEELAYLSGLSHGRVTSRELAEAVGLRGRESQRVSHLSAGEKQRLALAAVFALESSVILLDEPLAYLDYWGAREFVSNLEGMLGEKTVLVAEHRLWFFRDLEPRVLVLEGGRVVFVGAYREACERGFERLDLGSGCAG